MTAAVVLCGAQAPPVGSLGSDVTVVPDLCSYPGEMATGALGADRLVLGVCPGEYSLARLQTEARRLGIDPLGIELVIVAEAGADAARLALAVAAATARAEAFAGSGPQHAKLSFPARVNRRDLLRAFSPEYLAAPAITAERCVADAGCRACVDACPRQAYRWVAGRVTYDRSVCEPCGICVTSCPAGAIANPSITPAQLAAQLAVLLDPTVGPAGPRGVVFACSRGEAEVAAPDWYAVRVPCTAMVTATWLLAPLLLGAGAVSLLPCSASGCPLHLDAIARATVGFATELLTAFGASNRVHPGPGESVPAPWRPVPLDDPFEPLGGAAVLAGLAAASRAALPAIDHERSPVGVVAVDQSVCTLCGMCAAACPTGALAFRVDEDVTELSFDSAICTGCRQCLPRCPELRAGAIAVDRRVDAAALSAGRTALAGGGSARCARCGGPIASERLLEHLRARLGPEHSSAFGALSAQCVRCRGRLTPGRSATVPRS